jgi:GNAT superfamily N-acetyltransferase
VPAAPLDVYAAAFAERIGRCDVDEPGVRGVREPRLRLLVTDDRAHERLEAILAGDPAGLVTVVAAATRCTRRLAGEPAWTAKALTAMVCADLGTVPALALPDGLSLRPIRRLDGEPAGVPLEDAVALAASPADEVAAYLRSLPPGYRFLAAVDGDGAVRATSGAGVFGTSSSVLLVNTDPAWRRRGLGTAMTAAALYAAREAGARRACLDASDAGRSLYARLGFAPAGRVTQFYRAPAPAGHRPARRSHRP